MAICPYCRGAVRWSTVETEEREDGEGEMLSCPHCSKVLGFR